MIRIVYLSVATKMMSQEELLGLLEQSRKNNLKLEITGMLLYGDGSFLQILEGGRENVKNLYAKILIDERHKECILIDKSPIDERAFSAWSMGFKYLQSKEIAAIEGFSEFLERKVDPSEFVKKADDIIDLLYEFKQQT